MPSFYEILFTRSTAKSIGKVGRTVILVSIETQPYAVYIERYDLYFFVVYGLIHVFFEYLVKTKLEELNEPEFNDQTEHSHQNIFFLLNYYQIQRSIIRLPIESLASFKSISKQ